MKVKELIEQLKTLDQDAEIMTYHEYGWNMSRDSMRAWDPYEYDDIYKIDRPNDADGAYVIYSA